MIHLFPSTGKDVGADDSVGPFVRIHRTASFAATPQLCLRRPTFSALPEKVGKKRRWKRIGLYRGATERARRRMLRPAHGNLPTNLYYSAACVETTLPSEIVAAQGDGKTPCCGNNSASTHSLVVQMLWKMNRADRVVRPYRVQCMTTDSLRSATPFSRKSAANSLVPNGPMWASAPTRCCGEL